MLQIVRPRRPPAREPPPQGSRTLARKDSPQGDADAITVAGRCDARRRSRAWSNATLPNPDLRTRCQASSAVTTPSFFHATMEGKSSCRRFARAVRSVRFRDRRARTPKCTSTPKGRARTTRSLTRQTMSPPSPLPKTFSGADSL